MSKQIARARRNKSGVTERPQTKAKFLEISAEIETVQQQSVPKFTPANARQKEAIAMLREGRSVVFLTGSAGTWEEYDCCFPCCNAY